MLPTLPKEPSLSEVFKNTKGGLGAIFEEYDRQKQEQAQRLAQHQDRVQETLLKLAEQRTTADPRKAWRACRWFWLAGGLDFEPSSGGLSGYSLEFTFANRWGALGSSYTREEEAAGSPIPIFEGFPNAVTVEWQPASALVQIFAVPAKYYGRDPSVLASQKCTQVLTRSSVGGENRVTVELRSWAGDLSVPIEAVYAELL